MNATDESRLYSREAILLCKESLLSAVVEPTQSARKSMVNAAYLAGKAIGISKTTAAHALSYSLTSHYGVTHGHAVALFLPAVFELNSEVDSGIIDELCELLGCASVSEAVEYLNSLKNSIGLTSDCLRDQQVTKSEISSNVLAEVNYERLNNNPVALDESKIVWALNTII